MRAMCLLDPPEYVAHHGRRAHLAISSIYRVALAREPWQILGYGSLRRAVFCEEQKLFECHDLDENDRHAIPIVALSYAAGMALDVVGTVRIYQTAPRQWIGSRLAINADWRGLPIAAQLIRAAVCTAKRLGCDQFTASVQIQNVPLFRRLRWQSLEEEVVCGLLHHRLCAPICRATPATDALAFELESAA